MLIQEFILILIFTFYVDENYTLLKMFEGWMEYISSGSDGSHQTISQNHIIEE